MATGNAQVLREYLVSLGYRIDQESEGKLDKSLDRTSRYLTRMALGIKGVVIGAHYMMREWARSMESMYYSSRRAESTVSSLKALDFGARNVGVNNMTQALEALARSIRTNPGLQGLIEAFGIPVTGRNRADVAMDLLDTLRKMPFYIGSQYAQLFGIDSDTYLLLTEGLDKMREAARLRQEWADRAGVDTDRAAEAARDYANELRGVSEVFGLLKDQAAIALLPAFKEIAAVTREVLTDWIRLTSPNGVNRMTDGQGFMGFLRKMAEGAGLRRTGGGVVLSQDAQRRLAGGGASSAPTPTAFRGTGTDALRLAAVAGDPESWQQMMSNAFGLPEDFFLRFQAVADDPESLFSMLESTFGLQPGILDKMWAKESSRGRNMRSPKGAKGHFQFMDRTAAEYGVADPDDLNQSALGAALYLNRLLRKYGNDYGHALAAYNWGQGNVDRLGVGRAPAETRDYVKTLTGQPLVVEQDTRIFVTSPDPVAAGRAVAAEQRGVNSDMAAALRNNLGVVR